MEHIYLGAEHHFPSAFHSDASQDFRQADGLAMPSAYGLYDESQTYHGLPIPGVDDNGDMANRARLTSEQLAELEREFSVNHKPNTDHKKVLADRMRVEYPKVNVSGVQLTDYLPY